MLRVCYLCAYRQNSAIYTLSLHDALPIWLGFRPEQADEVRRFAIANSRLICSGIYSHYSSAEDGGSQTVYSQQECFKSVLAFFEEVPLIHMSNTGDICNYSNIDHFDMVRK